MTDVPGAFHRFRGSWPISACTLASTAPWLARSVGFVGFSDGWQQLRADKRLRQTYARAGAAVTDSHAGSGCGRRG